MVEVEGEIAEQIVYVLIDLGSTHSYITPGLTEMCTLKKSKHRRSWLVQIATGIQKDVSEVVMKCPLVMDGLLTCADLNVLPLGSYDVLTGMNWLEAHRAKLDKEGNLKFVKGHSKK